MRATAQSPAQYPAQCSSTTRDNSAKAREHAQLKESGGPYVQDQLSPSRESGPVLCFLTDPDLWWWRQREIVVTNKIDLTQHTHLCRIRAENLPVRARRPGAVVSASTPCDANSSDAMTGLDAL